MKPLMIFAIAVLMAASAAAQTTTNLNLQPELAEEPAANDWFYVWDLSAGRVKKISRANLLLNGVSAASILPGAISNSHIGASAAIDLSKLATNPLARANHTGTQTASTISDWDAAVRAQLAAALIAGENVTITPSGSGGSLTLTLDASGMALTENIPIDPSWPLESKIRGRTGSSSDLNIFSTKTHSGAGTYARSALHWAAGVDLTALAVYNSTSGDSRRAGIAITPDHIAFANHYQIANGATVRFVTADNQVVSRTISNQVQAGDSYLQIARLSSSLPSTIRPARLLPQGYTDYLSLVGLHVFSTDQESKALVHVITSDNANLGWVAPLTAPHSSLNEVLGTGDSGSPICLIHQGGLVLLSVATESFIGPSIGKLHSEINGALTTLGGAGVPETASGATLYAAYTLPLPTATKLGGVKRNAGTEGQFVTGIDSAGALTYATPAGGGGLDGSTGGNGAADAGKAAVFRTNGGLRATSANASEQGIIALNTGGGIGGEFGSTNNYGVKSTTTSGAGVISITGAGTPFVAETSSATNFLQFFDLDDDGIQRLAITRTGSLLWDAGAVTVTKPAVGGSLLTSGSTLAGANLTNGSVALSKLATDPLARANHTGTQPWSTISDTPNDLDGYGIDDAQPLDDMLTSISDLTAPAGDRIAFYDHSADKWEWLEVGANLAIEGTTISAASGGSGSLVWDDLESGTVLAVNNNYFAAFSTGRTLTFTGSPSNGDTIRLNGIVTSGPVTIGIPASYRVGNESTETSVLLGAGTHLLTWQYIDGKWVLSDSAVDAEDAYTLYGNFTGSAAAPGFSAAGVLDFGGWTSLELPNGASPTVDAFGEIAGDNNLWASGRGALVTYDGTSATALIGVLVSDTPTNGQVPVWNTGGTITWENQAGAGSGDVTAASAFANDNRLIRSDGTGKGVQASGITVDDSNNVSGAALSTAENVLPAEIGLAASDETTAITTGNGKLTFRMPYAMTLTAVRASVTTAPTGADLVIDINESGTTILSTKLSIDATEKTSTTAAAAAVISDAALADDAEITIDFDQVGSTVAGTGVKIWLIGTK